LCYRWWIHLSIPPLDSYVRNVIDPTKIRTILIYVFSAVCVRDGLPTRIDTLVYAAKTKQSQFQPQFGFHVQSARSNLTLQVYRGIDAQRMVWRYVTEFIHCFLFVFFRKNYKWFVKCLYCCYNIVMLQKLI